MRNFFLLAALLFPLSACAADTVPAPAPAPALATAQGNSVTANPTIVLDTTLGEITLELDAAKAPLSTANFVEYVKSGHYDGTQFHRVIKGFMVQGGGFDEKGNQRGTRAPIKNEGANGLKNVRGSIAMARTNAPDSATAQFFINHKDNGFLDYPGRDGAGYAVFGKVTGGMDVVDKIAEVPTGPKGSMGTDVPATAVVVRKATVKDAAGK